MWGEGTFVMGTRHVAETRIFKAERTTVSLMAEGVHRKGLLHQGLTLRPGWGFAKETWSKSSRITLNSSVAQAGLEVLVLCFSLLGS